MALTAQRATTGSSEIWIDEEGFLRIKNRSGVAIDRDEADTILTECTKLTKGKKLPLIVDPGGIRSMTREARTLFASKRAEDIIAGQAILMTSPVGRAIGSFFLGLNKPPFPTALVPTLEDAKSWLLRLAR